jgi:hypothetical protein
MFFGARLLTRYGHKPPAKNADESSRAKKLL